MQEVLSVAFVAGTTRTIFTTTTRYFASGLRLLPYSVLSDRLFKGQSYTQSSYSFYRRTFTSLSHTTTSTGSEDVRALSIRSGQWAEKESLYDYLKNRVINLTRYFESLQRSPHEDELAERMMSRYLSQEAYHYLEALPYRLDLKTSDQTLENSGSHFFSQGNMAFYLENGFVGPVKIKSVSQERLKEIHARFTGMLKGFTPDQNRTKILRQEWRDKDVLDLVTNKEIVAKVSSLLGENIKMRFTSMHEVPPGTGSFSDMTNGQIPDFYAHSDMNLGTAVIPRIDTEKPFCDRDAVSVWISISGTHEHNAPLFVFPRTHQWDITTPLTYLEHAKHDKKALTRVCRLLSTKGFANQLNANHFLYYDYLLTSHYRSMLSTTKKTEMYMAPGDCLFFTTHLLHGSGINQSPVSRLGMSIRYSRAMNSENEENLSVVKALFSKSECARLGLTENEDRIPVLQVLGTKHHEKSKPVNIAQLREILEEKASKQASERDSIFSPSVVKADQVNSMHKDYIRSGQWAEKGPMDTYLRQALEICRKYVSSVELSPDEQAQFRLIKFWYQKEYTPQKTTLLPFIKLEAIGDTFEASGGDYLKEREISFYLENGLIGPIHVHSLNKSLLNAISDRFPNFNRNYFRNLGSLYSALKNKCLLELATNSEILSKVSSILGDHIMLCNMTIHEIGAGSGKSSNETNGMVDAFNCHSDLSSGSHYYFRPGANQVENLTLDNRGVCVWVSISGTTPNNSPLYVFPTTHRWEITTPFTHIENARNHSVVLDHVLKLLAFNHRNPARRMGLCNMEYEYLLSSQYKSLLPRIQRTEIYTQPGDIIMFNQHTRHGSGFNSSSESRLAVSLRFNTALKEVGGTEFAGAVVTQAEREILGFGNDKRKPMVQLLGKQHHPNNVPIDLTRLSKEPD